MVSQPFVALSDSIPSYRKRISQRGRCNLYTVLLTFPPRHAQWPQTFLSRRAFLAALIPFRYNNSYTCNAKIGMVCTTAILG
jgi:hypothetical protein